MKFKYFSAVKTLKSRSVWWLRKWRFSVTKTSVVLHIEIECEGKLSIKRLRRDSQLFFLKNPRPNIYSLASRTRCKFFLPEPFSDFTKMFNNLIFIHPREGGRSLRYTISQLFQQSFCFFFFIFHYLCSPYFKNILTLGDCQCKRGGVSRGSVNGTVLMIIFILEVEILLKICQYYNAFI